MATKLRVNKAVCIACGQCYSAFPDIFESDAEGKAQVKAGAQFLPEKVDEMVNICSVQAIEKYEE
jgi:ferredoxin